MARRIRRLEGPHAPLRLGAYFKNRREPGRVGLPILSVTMRNGLVSRDEIEKRTESALTPEQHLLVRSGDIAYNMMRMWQGACGLATEDALVSPAYVVLEPRPSIDPSFAYHWLKSPRMLYLLWAYSYGLTDDRLRLYYDEFARIPASPPPVSAQRAIATVLDGWDEAIALSEGLAEANRRQKSWLIHHLLVGTASPRGRLSEIAYINPAAPLVAGHEVVSFVAMEDVSNDGRLVTRTDRIRSSLGGGYTGFIDGDTLVAKITPSFENGKGAFASELTNSVGFGSTEFHVLRAREGVLPRYVYHLTRTEMFRLLGERIMTGSAGQKRVPTSFLEDHRVPHPTAAEQARIVGALDAADEEINLVNARTDLLRRQKRGLMQKLFMGEWLVPKSAELLLPNSLSGADGAEAAE